MWRVVLWKTTLLNLLRGKLLYIKAQGLPITILYISSLNRLYSFICLIYSYKKVGTTTGYPQNKGVIIIVDTKELLVPDTSLTYFSY